jgi:SAM-dependent methyltransferase
MSTTPATISPVDDAHGIDETRVEAFLDRFLTDIAGAATGLMTAIGDRLGLYGTMTGTGPWTAPELASATGLNERLVTEWLAAQTVSSYVVYDPATRTYELPSEHAMVLSVTDSPVHLVSVAEMMAAQYQTLDQLERAFRTDGGIDYGELPAGLFRSIERFFRTAYTHELVSDWFPAVEGLVARLEAGARVADLGCGHGVATLLMADTWPDSTFVGFDLHAPSIAVARSRALETGAGDNVSFKVADAAGLSTGPFDVVVFFDALHDLGDPPAALQRAHEVLTDGGIIVAVEPWSTDRLEDSIGNPSARIDFACSTALCTPCSLHQPGAYGLGTQGGPTRRLQLLADAGFRNPTLAADTGFNLVLAASK